MIQNFTLSGTDPNEAASALSALISDPWIFLVVLGTSPEAYQALEVCYGRINSGHPYYRGVRCIHIPVLQMVLPSLKSLRVKSNVQLDWSSPQDYLICSISAVYNNIGYAYTTEKYLEMPAAKTDRLVLKATAADLPL